MVAAPPDQKIGKELLEIIERRLRQPEKEEP